MMTAPRNGGYLRLHRYGKPRTFIGRWAADDGCGWWHNEKGERMTHVHSWEFIPENVQGHTPAPTRSGTITGKGGDK
jgi:hypothetical protein